MVDLNNILAISQSDAPFWTFGEGVELCRSIYKISKDHGHFPALTGGLLYKERVPRKDLDVVFYSYRQIKVTKSDRKLMMKVICRQLDLSITKEFNWLVKCKTKDGKVIDFFFPEVKKLPTDADGYSE